MKRHYSGSPRQNLVAAIFGDSYRVMREPDNMLENVLDYLTPREKKVLVLRFGLEDGRSRTLQEIGREFNVSRQWIREIEAKALRKLRRPARSKHLRLFVEDAEQREVSNYIDAGVDLG